MERHAQDPHELTFYGHEKNRVTTRLAKMNLAVHGLEGNVEGGEAAITYYNDPHEGLFGTVDYVMANPPFNVDEVDADKIKGDKRRLPFGLPGVNKNKKVSNANHLWIQYFYSYLNDTGRAGFVMSSQASSAGRDEAKVREQLVKSGHVDIMVDIRDNFFYTRSVPCQLWFLNKNKPAHLKDKVLMLDARNVYRKVTRKIYDFSPAQQQNLTAVVWLYRGEGERFIELVQQYIDKSIFEARYCEFSDELMCNPVPDFITQLGKLSQAFQPFMDKLEQDGTSVEPYVDFLNAKGSVEGGWSAFQTLTNDLQKWWNEYEYNDAASLLAFIDKDACLKGLAEQSRNLIKEIDLAYKLATRVIEQAEANDAKDSELWDNTLLNGRGLDEKSLVLFDLLCKPNLQPKEIAKIKQVATALLTTLKVERLRIANWQQKESTRDAVKQQIFDFLYDERTGLPVEQYEEAEISDITERVFLHVYRAYPELPSPIYG